MTFQHTNAIRRINGLSPIQAFVLRILTDLADKDGFCFPGIDYISLETRLHKRTVIYTLLDLEEMHVITRATKPKRGVRTGYKLLFDECLDKEVSLQKERGQRLTRKGRTVEGTIEEVEQPKRTQRTQQLPTPIAPEREVERVTDFVSSLSPDANTVFWQEKYNEALANGNLQRATFARRKLEEYEKQRLGLPV